MTKYYLTILFLFAGCSTYPFRKIPVTSREQAALVINNQVDFLYSTFEQSKEPYYGGLKWSQTCIDENKIGKLEEHTDYLKSDSLLYLNDSGEAGFCSGTQSHLIYLYCNGDKFVRELKIPHSSKNETSDKTLCD